jgi:hypothetical protein
VTDHGVGIAPEDQDRIFHEFVQLGKNQLQEGTGLGLPISRRLAEMLRGSLTVTSKAGQGSTFRLTLPESAESRAPRAAGEAESDAWPADAAGSKGGSKESAKDGATDGAKDARDSRDASQRARSGARG